MREAKFMMPEPFEWTPESTLIYPNRAGIAMQMLSNLPRKLDALKESNDYAASLVGKYSTRFGLLAALLTDKPEAALAEIDRATHTLHIDGFAVICNYIGVFLGDPSLDPVSAELNRQHAVVFVIQTPTPQPRWARPSPLIEVATSWSADAIRP